MGWDRFFSASHERLRSFGRGTHQGAEVCPAVAAEVCFRSSKNIDDKAEICGWEQDGPLPVVSGVITLTSRGINRVTHL